MEIALFVSVIILLILVIWILERKSTLRRRYGRQDGIGSGGSYPYYPMSAIGSDSSGFSSGGGDGGGSGGGDGGGGGGN